MSLSGFRQTVLGVVMCTALTAQAAAASTIAVGVTNTTGSQLVSDISFTLGWSFTALNDIVVTDSSACSTIRWTAWERATRLACGAAAARCSSPRPWRAERQGCSWATSGSPLSA